ncbi:MAG: hypothetical protein FWE53_04530 [Firmicutes bacterium]|nr:hypothetical protein [Bacillota bacterium]
MSEQEQQRISEFYEACSNLGGAKFILADARLGKILRAVSASQTLIDIVSDCINGFSFESELSKAQVKNQLKTIGFRMPFEREKVIALGFCLLNEFDSKRIDLHQFLFEYFGSNDAGASECFDKFVTAVIVPFRDELCAAAGFEPNKQEKVVREQIMFEDNEEETSEEELCDCEDCNCTECDCGEECGEDELDYVQTFFYDLCTILDDIAEEVNGMSVKQDRRDEIIITIEALEEACALQNFKLINALLISLNFLLSKTRGAKRLNQKLQERVSEFYSFLPEE